MPRSDDHQANPDFKPVVSDGDGNTIQYCKRIIPSVLETGVNGLYHRVC